VRIALEAEVAEVEVEDGGVGFDPRSGRGLRAA
jgi:hypothetical protein